MLVQLIQGMRPDVRIRPETQFVSAVTRSGKASIKDLFAGRLAWVTPVIWAYYMISSIALFFLSNWSPKLLVVKGYSDSEAAFISGFVNILVAIGCLLSGFYFDKVGFRWGSILHVIAAVCVYFLGGLEPTAFVVLLFITGFFMNSAHMDITILAPIVYPSNCRNQGAGAAISVGRIGAMAGPYIGGVLLDSPLPMSSQLAVAAVPLAIAAVLCYIAGRQYDFHFAPLYAGKITPGKE